jgi:menaquinone-dependent protoporphyrinogen IX oxidase
MEGAMLVVFYSRTGFTRAVAQDLARVLKADLEELIDLTNRQGILGYLRSGFDAAFRRLTQLRPLSTKPEAHDLVVVGTPIWNASISSPVRTFLINHKAALKRVAFFCTYGGSGQERVFRQMAEVCGKAPLATMAVRDREMGGAMQATRLREFVDRLQAAAPTR